MVAKGCQGTAVGWHGVVGEVSAHHPGQPASLFGHVLVPASPEVFGDFQQLPVIGLDVHRSFAQVAELENGVLRQCGRVDLVRDKVLAFARTLRADDEMVLEATGNTMAIVKLLKPHVGRVFIANPLQVRVIAEVKAKTDRIDAARQRTSRSQARRVLGHLPVLFRLA